MINHRSHLRLGPTGPAHTGSQPNSYRLTLLAKPWCQIPTKMVCAQHGENKEEVLPFPHPENTSMQDVYMKVIGSWTIITRQSHLQNTQITVELIATS